MKILLTGVETNNKGAELMLYAILQEIERKFPKATVYISSDRIRQGIDYITTKVDFRVLPFSKIEKDLKLNAAFRILHLPYSFMPHNIALGGFDYYLDGSGFRFSDQFNPSHRFAQILDMQLSSMRKKGAKIVYLPQAFGPFEKQGSRDVLSVINRYAAILMPREKVSYEYLERSGVVDMSKVKLFTDFTSLVNGVFPPQYERLKKGICIIPNMQMINKGAISYDDYIDLLVAIIDEGKQSGRPVYLLNHEGVKDEKFAYQCQNSVGGSIEVVTGLNSLEVKGLIASAYLVVTSRFHGLASALNSCVPCLATSWSHKYKELFNDYAMGDCIIPLDDKNKAMQMLGSFMEESKNQEVRNTLSEVVPRIKKRTHEMWETVWK